MTEIDKLLVRIGTARDAISRKTEQTSLDYMIDGVLMNCSVMLKEREKPNGKCVNECECWDSAYERGKQDALKEQETELCDRCGRRRLKSNMEGW